MLCGLDSGKTSQRIGRLPLVIGMPVMITSNFDVPGGVVNSCNGTLVSVRYTIGVDRNRCALLCVVKAPDMSLGIMPNLPDYHVVALSDKMDMKFKH
ncbi:hypothetical protein B0H17DRAFT_959856, partial [Mycena rosella]